MLEYEAALTRKMAIPGFAKVAGGDTHGWYCTSAHFIVSSSFRRIALAVYLSHQLTTAHLNATVDWRPHPRHQWRPRRVSESCSPCRLKTPR